MKPLFSIFALLLSVSLFANGPQWGKTGHRATAEIADGYLSKKARKEVADLLNDESMALVSNYMDDVKSDRKYDKYGSWHYINIDEGQTYDDVKDPEKKNIIYGIKKAKEKLKNKSTPKDEKQFYLKMLIHLIGDLHQPMHVGRKSDLGGNRVQVTWFGDLKNLHKVWDESLLDSYQMSYTELAVNQKKLSTKELKEMQQGNAEDWLKESHKITNAIYKHLDENNSHFSYDYMYKWMPTVREQLQKGGVRLAKELNEIFG